MKKVKIVCTIGPACLEYNLLFSMAESGMDVARFNFSHGTYEQHEKAFSNIRKIERQRGKPIATILDTKGPEIRTGEVVSEHVHLEEGQIFSLVKEEKIGNDQEVSVTTPEL
ncbi:MAG TPA: pyruvate kinase, partial [Synergistales bacterium]|nr:pyruvate kinase [Synergistales bacterium]